MYQIIRSISFLIRAFLCYCTIDNIPILGNSIYNNILLEVVSLYAVLWAISYFITGKFYSKGDNPTLGAIIYFFVYMVALAIMYLIMLFLTVINILPI